MIRSTNANMMLVGTALIALCSSAWAEAESVPAQEAQHQTSPVVMSEDLSQRSDTELTALTAQWGSLSPSERRRLLAEVRGRMAANQSVRRPIGVRVQRQYGRVVRKADGSVVVQTRVVRVRPRVMDDQAVSRVTFGFGFERRSQSRQQAAPPASEAQQPPVVTVSQEQAADANR